MYTCSNAFISNVLYPKMLIADRAEEFVNKLYVVNYTKIYTIFFAGGTRTSVHGHIHCRNGCQNLG